MCPQGFRHDAVPVPSICPTYYWLNHGLAESLGIELREPTFLSNPRTPASVLSSVALLDICVAEAKVTPAGCAGGVAVTALSSGGGSDGGSGVMRLFSPARTTPAALARLMARATSARLLRITDLAPLMLEGASRIRPLSIENKKVAPNAKLGGGVHELTQLTSGFWCTSCVITRRGGVVQEVNRSVVRELEKFCRVEARGNLGYPHARQTCCQKVKSADGCPVCMPGERRTRNESTLSFHMRQYLPVWAKLPEPLPLHPHGGGGAAEAIPESEWRCTHPLCAGHEPDKFP